MPEGKMVKIGRHNYELHDNDGHCAKDGICGVCNQPITGEHYFDLNSRGATDGANFLHNGTCIAAALLGGLKWMTET